MKVNGRSMRTIWLAEDGWSIQIIDQRELPHHLKYQNLQTTEQAARAIAEMWVRGAPLIGVTAAYGICFAMRKDPSEEGLEAAHAQLLATRPTAINLRWALDKMRSTLLPLPEEERVAAAYAQASAITEDDAECCSKIGDHGLGLIQELAKKKQGTIGILTHCNAGWLATVDWGTALAPIYKAHDAGIELMVYVDETRPRNQGASLTAWELSQHKVPHRVIVDNAGGHLMQRGMVDLCIVGSDRTTSNGDVCNKIGTYLKALAAHDNDVPFYVALPHSTIDWTLSDGVADIPIEERSEREVTHIRGLAEDGSMAELALTPKGSRALNFAFDVTPARYVTGLITERGVAEASTEGLAALFPTRRL
jgi:methylthioribose-1-phosphate isomerase